MHISAWSTLASGTFCPQLQSTYPACLNQSREEACGDSRNYNQLCWEQLCSLMIGGMESSRRETMVCQGQRLREVLTGWGVAAQADSRSWRAHAQVLTGSSRLSRLPLRDSFEHTLADFFSTEKAHGPRIIFAFDDGQPRNTVIEHGCGCDEGGILQSYVD